jgi:hypothetical protein
MFELNGNALIIVRHHESDHLNQGVVETFISPKACCTGNGDQIWDRYRSINPELSGTSGTRTRLSWRRQMV